MEDKINENKDLAKAYYSAFYHPYLGLKGLKKVVNHLETIDQATWLDLKKENNAVQVKDIRIESKNGEVIIDKPFIASSYEKKLVVKKVSYFLIPLGLFIGILITYIIVNHRLKNEEK